MCQSLVAYGTAQSLYVAQARHCAHRGADSAVVRCQIYDQIYLNFYSLKEQYPYIATNYTSPVLHSTQLNQLQPATTCAVFPNDSFSFRPQNQGQQHCLPAGALGAAPAQPRALMSWHATAENPASSDA